MNENLKNNKKLLIIVIIVLAAILLAGLVFLGIRLWGQFAAPKVAITEEFSHSVPRDLPQDGAVTMTSQEGFREVLMLAGGYTETAEPLYYYDENGEAVGQYVYDETGWVYGWRSDKGKVTKLPEDQQFEFPYTLTGGEPLLMTGDAQVHAIVYADQDIPVKTYLYFILSEAGDMDVFVDAMNRANMGLPEKVSENVAEVVLEREDIEGTMTRINPEFTLEDYLNWLSQMYGVE